MKRFFTLSLALMVLTVSLAYSAGEVAIYTGQTQWIGKDVADEHTDKYTKLLDDAGIKNTWFKNDMVHVLTLLLFVMETKNA